MNNLKEIREKNNLTVKQLANLLKVSSGRIQEWEKDLATPSIEHLQSLSYLYDVSLDELLPYTKPDTLSFNMRANAVKKKYKRKFNIIMIALISIITIVSLLIVTITALYPQIHAKQHAQAYYDKTINYVRTETNEDLESVLYFANIHSTLEQDKYVESIAIVTFDSNYLIYFHNGKMRAILDISKGLNLTTSAKIHVGDKEFDMPVGDYQEVYYLIIYETPEVGLKDLVLAYKESKN